MWRRRERGSWRRRRRNSRRRGGWRDGEMERWFTAGWKNFEGGGRWPAIRDGGNESRSFSWRADGASSICLGPRCVGPAVVSSWRVLIVWRERWIHLATSGLCGRSASVSNRSPFPLTTCGLFGSRGLLLGLRYGRDWSSLVSILLSRRCLPCSLRFMRLVRLVPVRYMTRRAGIWYTAMTGVSSNGCEVGVMTTGCGHG